MTVNRKITPATKEIESFNIVKAVKHILPNNLPLYRLNTGEADIIKLEWMFSAGNWYQSSPLIAFAVNSMLCEGSEKFTSAQIAEKVEFYGANLSYNVDKDNAFITLTCLGKYLADVLPVIEDMIKNAVFPQHELDAFKNKHKQQFIVEQTKVRNIARSEHSRMLFGNNHPYGYVTVEEDFDRLAQSELIRFYKKQYQSQHCRIIASGKVDDKAIKTIEKHFGVEPWSLLQDATNYDFPIETERERKIFITKADAVQSAVRIGKVLFTKQHPDYNSISILNCILGGYFGSRLMKKIREEKGYTYGINSLLVSFKNAGYFAIVSELGTEVTVPAIDDIYAEIARLGTDLVSEEELNRVKNYMLGDIVRMFDGPFAQAESLISLLEYDLDYDFFDAMIQTIKNITPEEIRVLAKKYLDPGSFSQAVVGNMK
jgi:predicted Zn-dependent peptidase